MNILFKPKNIHKYTRKIGRRKINKSIFSENNRLADIEDTKNKRK